MWVCFFLSIALGRSNSIFISSSNTFIHVLQNNLSVGRASFVYFPFAFAHRSIGRDQQDRNCSVSDSCDIRTIMLRMIMLSHLTEFPPSHSYIMCMQFVHGNDRHSAPFFHSICLKFLSYPIFFSFRLFWFVCATRNRIVLRMFFYPFDKNRTKMPTVEKPQRL